MGFRQNRQRQPRTPAGPSNTPSVVGDTGLVGPTQKDIGNQVKIEKHPDAEADTCPRADVDAQTDVNTTSVGEMQRQPLCDNNCQVVTHGKMVEADVGGYWQNDGARSTRRRVDTLSGSRQTRHFVKVGR